MNSSHANSPQTGATIRRARGTNPRLGALPFMAAWEFKSMVRFSVGFAAGLLALSIDGRAHRATPRSAQRRPQAKPAPRGPPAARAAPAPVRRPGTDGPLAAAADGSTAAAPSLQPGRAAPSAPRWRRRRACRRTDRRRRPSAAPQPGIAAPRPDRRASAASSTPAARAVEAGAVVGASTAYASKRAADPRNNPRVCSNCNRRAG